ncbi:MAG: RidA family protein [Gracilibacteraceae bacterium]|jgi:2-iminobutanoate/2-iminopropanoate deaminase|nr:RidA family protein [Gracilibacteraceae bacterium]
MNQLITFDSAELLEASHTAMENTDLAEQLKIIFRLAESTLAEDGMDLNNVVFIIAEVADMRDRSVVNEAQKALWTPEHYPCRIILERGGYKAGAKARLLFTATKAPHTMINSFKGQIPTGPFSRTAVVAGRVYGSGVRAISPETQRLVSEDLRIQTKQCLQNLDTNLKSSGTFLEKAWSFTTYLTDLANVGLVMEVFREQGFDPGKVQMSFEKVDALNEYHPVEIACNALL